MSHLDDKLDTLTPRQIEILKLIAKDLQMKEVARLLKISEHTVKAHSDEARRRLGVSHVREAARIILERTAYEEQTEDYPPPPSERLYRSERIDKPQVFQAFSHNEHEPITELQSVYARQGIPDLPLEGSGSRALDDSQPLETELGHRDYPVDFVDTTSQRTGEGSLHISDGNRLVDERRARGGLERIGLGLKRLSVSQCLGLILGISIVMVFGAVAFITGSVAIIQSIRFLFK